MAHPLNAALTMNATHLPAAVMSGLGATLLIVATPSKRHECTAGWTAHYLIGATIAMMFVSVASASWLARPTLLPAVAFGVATVLVPFFTIQPAFGMEQRRRRHRIRPGLERKA